MVPPIQMSLQYAVHFLDDDELVEITQKSIRINDLEIPLMSMKEIEHPGRLNLGPEVAILSS